MAQLDVVAAAGKKTNGGRRIRALSGSRPALVAQVRSPGSPVPALVDAPPARMAQKKYLQARLTQFLREDRIQLWKPPYTAENKEAGLELKDLAKKYSDKLDCSETEVEKIVEEIRRKAVERGAGNENFKTKGIATIEVFLPPRLGKDRKNLLETRLHITGRELRSRIAEKFGFQENYIKIVINKKQLQLGETLEGQGVTHNVKAMVLELKQCEEDARRNFQVEEEEQSAAEQKERRIQRTKRGLEILAERGACPGRERSPSPEERGTPSPEESGAPSPEGTGAPSPEGRGAPVLKRVESPVLRGQEPLVMRAEEPPVLRREEPQV